MFQKRKFFFTSKCFIYLLLLAKHGFAVSCLSSCAVLFWVRLRFESFFEVSFDYVNSMYSTMSSTMVWNSVTLCFHNIFDYALKLCSTERNVFGHRFWGRQNPCVRPISGATQVKHLKSNLSLKAWLKAWPEVGSRKCLRNFSNWVLKTVKCCLHIICTDNVTVSRRVCTHSKFS